MHHISNMVTIGNKIWDPGWHLSLWLNWQLPPPRFWNLMSNLAGAPRPRASEVLFDVEATKALAYFFSCRLRP